MILFFSIMFQPAGKVATAFILSISRQGVIFSIVLVVVEFAAGYMGIIVWAQTVSDIHFIYIFQVELEICMKIYRKPYFHMLSNSIFLISIHLISF